MNVVDGECMAISTHLTTDGRRGELRIAPPALLSDEALAARVRRGDERAFEALYRRYRDPLYRYCASILRHPEDAEEALQSVMVSAFRSLTHAEARELRVRPWLYRIAHNQCISALRRRPRHAAEALTGAEASPSPGPAERFETGEELLRLREDLLALPDDQRGALVMRELSGLSHGQIADVLGESAPSVKQLIYQARAALHGMADGRRMDCHDVRRRISDGDGRVLRSRSVGAHLRACQHCRSFRETTSTRPGQLAALAPVLPMGAADRILEAVFGVSGSLGGGGGGGAMIGAGAAVTSGLPALGGGMGAKVAAVVAAGALGGSIVAVPLSTTDSLRDHQHDRVVAATSRDSVAPEAIPTAARAGLRGVSIPARPAGAMATGPADQGAPALAVPGRAAADPEPVDDGRPGVTGPTVPVRTPGDSGRVGGTLPPLPVSPALPVQVPVLDGPRSDRAMDALVEVGTTIDAPAPPASAPANPIVVSPPTVANATRGPSAQPGLAYPSAPDPPLPGVALAP